MSSRFYVPEKDILQAIEKVNQIVLATGNEQDLFYFNYHKKRFFRMATTIAQHCEPGQLLLDIGSHYLHSSLILSFMGYQVHSMDVSEFCTLPFIKARIVQNNLIQIEENNLEKLSSLSEEFDKYNLILFTEIFEHITFNPIGFWKRIFTIIKQDGLIYITTPNSLTLYAMVKNFYKLITLNGIGMDVNAIFPTVTYGHHWKEYSASEMRHYFKKMNDGFKLHITKYSYKPDQKALSIKRKGSILLEKIGNQIPFFKEALEVEVRVDKTFPWKVDIPQY